MIAPKRKPTANATNSLMDSHDFFACLGLTGWFNQLDVSCSIKITLSSLILITYAADALISGIISQIVCFLNTNALESPKLISSSSSSQPLITKFNVAILSTA